MDESFPEMMVEAVAEAVLILFATVASIYLWQVASQSIEFGYLILDVWAER